MEGDSQAYPQSPWFQLYLMLALSLEFLLM